LRQSDEATFHTTLPVEDPISHRKEPWLLHSLTVNTLNFCAFSMCYEGTPHASQASASPETNGEDAILIAVPGLQEGFVNIMQLPSEERLHTVSAAKKAEGGMIMTLRIFYKTGTLHLITGHESGVATLQILQDTKWKTVAASPSHTQPILSLDVLPDLSCYFTSGADSIVGMHSIEDLALGVTSPSVKTVQTVQTKHSGQQSLTIRSDGKIFATAGWDSRIRVYSAKTIKELAVLKWHKEGCYSVAFAEILHAPTSEVGSAVVKAGNSEGLSVRTVKQKSEDKARETHWLAAGSKDGKVSLWDIY
jgi:WD40 repeat protein